MQQPTSFLGSNVQAAKRWPALVEANFTEGHVPPQAIVQVAATPKINHIIF
ncbi:hypothetical protein CCACVL1_15982 [Corchorus capsularis]|uniref:Uncharacterized protein n=1 Tax=Corchorus capsularis TaxID=210143 RepID=A0A1R3I017_COCAP|nr:hypothetical protein CCACVL1_15982 [Corchorus capsularis]